MEYYPQEIEVTKFVVAAAVVTAVVVAVVVTAGFEGFAAEQGFVAAVELALDFAAKLLSEIELVFSLEIVEHLLRTFDINIVVL